MLANLTRKSMLEWLQLSPGLLSANPVQPVRAVTPPVVAVSEPVADDLHHSRIDVASVAPSKGMTFLAAAPTEADHGKGGGAVAAHHPRGISGR